MFYGWCEVCVCVSLDSDQCVCVFSPPGRGGAHGDREQSPSEHAASLPYGEQRVTDGTPGLHSQSNLSLSS